jgi:hypothetical protein
MVLHFRVVDPDMAVEWVVVKYPVEVEFDTGDVERRMMLTHIPVTAALKHDYYENRVEPDDDLWSASWDLDVPSTLPVARLLDPKPVDADREIETVTV